MAKPSYRVLFNQDCTDLFDATQEPLTPAHITRMVDEVAAGGADVFLVNVNSQQAVYPSRVWQRYWDGYTPGDRAFFGDVPDDSVARRDHWVGQMAHLATQCDYLDTALTQCRKAGVAPGVSLRMNDCHDMPWPQSHMFSRFYQDHPECRLDPVPARSWSGIGLNYAYPKVREHFLILIRELAEHYDFDVLELDFMRFGHYFNRGHTDVHCDIMNGFIRDVRKILVGTGRDIALIPRVASSPGAARQLGFDVRAWAREGLVDGITTANFLNTCWELPVDRFRELVGPDVAVYAASEVNADRRDGLPTRLLPTDHDLLRGFTAGHLALGADGVNVFNYFLARHGLPEEQTAHFFSGLGEMRSLQEARGKPRTHLLTAGYTLVVCDLPVQVPVKVATNTPRSFMMFLAAESEGQLVAVHVCVDGACEPGDLWLRIGLHPAGHAHKLLPGPSGTASENVHVAVFTVPAGAIVDGRNELVFRSEKAAVSVLGIDVHVR